MQILCDYEYMTIPPNRMNVRSQVKLIIVVYMPFTLQNKIQDLTIFPNIELKFSQLFKLVVSADSTLTLPI